MTHIVLDPSEMMLAATAGVMRQVENIKRGVKPAYGAGNERDWQYGIEGAMGEFALAKYLGIFWYGKGKMRGDDVGTLQVRTSSRDNGDLILHPRDDDEKVFWLLTGLNGTYDVRGFIKAKDGKKQEFWRDPTGKNRPAFFVPQSELLTP
jgi:hypothetical protein